MEKQFYVYIMANWNSTSLYTGVTSHLRPRAWQHKQKIGGVFTRKYNVKKLVYFEEHPDALSAIKREKQIKSGSRQKKLDLINKMNPQWEDLFFEL